MLRGTLVEYVYEPGGPEPYKCGYCKSQNTSMTQGVWGYKMTCQEYQDLVDRGFQRSGKFVYRPVMKKTCCPQYVIRMDVTKFKANKSQRRAVKRFKRYLIDGRSTTQDKSHDETVQQQQALPTSSTAEEESHSKDDSSVQDEVPSPSKKASMKRVIKPGVGADPNKPPCRKAKVIRMQRKVQKMTAQQQAKMDEDGGGPLRSASLGKIALQSQQSAVFQESLADLLAVPQSADNAHQFETRLVRVTSSSQEFLDTYTETYEVFKKFQMLVHKEKEEDCTPKQFDAFLVQTPLANEPGEQGMPYEYGTYHLQYILDGKIFAVGVLDILPKGVLCEYLYYNPEYRFIAPGVYTALQEIALAQRFYSVNPSMQYYYMGFYVQSCPKMNYKSNYSASSLLCPETYHYVPLELCVPKLIASEYSRLADDSIEDALDSYSEEDLCNVPVLSDMTSMTYATYKALNGDASRDLVEEYVKLVGLKVAGNMKLFISRRVQF